MYYDCTNYYFEIEMEDEFRKFGFFKEHRPNPIVQMGLFCDADEIPVAYDLFKGSQNGQISMVSIEEKMLNNVENSHLIVCADAKLCSANNKYFNSIANRDYIFVQSLKKIKEYLDDEIFDKNNNKWIKVNERFKYFVRPINDKINVTLQGNCSFKKEHEANIIVTYDQDFADYLAIVRENKIEKALNIIKHLYKYNKESSKDGKQYIKEINFDKNGETINKNLVLDVKKIEEEKKYDGYYALITSLVDESPEKVIAINKKRWESEDCFRIMKTNLKARPVYLSREERIKTHFLINFVALIVLKLLQKKLRATLPKEDTTILKILTSLREMEVTKICDRIYVNENISELTKHISELLNMNFDKKFFKQKYLNTLLD